MSKKRTIDFFYKRVQDVVQDPEIQTQTQTETETQTQDQTNGDNIVEESPEVQVEPETNATFNSNEVKLDSLIRDPGLRPPISSYPVNKTRLDELILDSDLINLLNHIILLLLVVLISVASKQHGLKDFGGWNILIRMMLHFVSHAIFLVGSL